MYRLQWVNLYMTNHLHLLPRRKLCNKINENLTLHQILRSVPDVKKAQLSSPLGYPAYEIGPLQ